MASVLTMKGKIRRRFTEDQTSGFIHFTSFILHK